MTIKNKPLYIHIPFCQHLCAYCDFPKAYYEKKQADDYLCALLNEIEEYQVESCPTIYIGGGTPSALSLDQLDKLLSAVAPLLQENGEFTMECNMENTDPEKLALFQKYGVNRLSFGVQSFQKDLLEEMGRHHQKEDVMRILHLAREMGFQNINIDLIYGFPKQTIEDIKRDISFFCKLRVPHISIYSLTISPHTLFAIQQVEERDQDDLRLFYDTIFAHLQQAGYQRYEVSNFALPGYASRHNQYYWRNDEYIGVGAGAHGYLQGIRYENTKSIPYYIKGKRVIRQEKVAKKDQMLYEVMLNLRTMEGIHQKQFVNRYGEEAWQQFIALTMQYQKKGFLIQDANRLYCSADGLMILDSMLRDFFYQLEKEE